MNRPSFLWLSPVISAIGKRFGIDAHYFAKNSAFVLLSQVVNVLKGIITGYLITRMLPQEMYGEYRFVLGITGTLGVLSLSGLPSAISRSVAKDGKNAPLPAIVRWYTLFSLLEVVITLGIIPFLSYWGRQDLWPLFLMAGVLSLPSNVATTIFGGIVTGRGSFSQGFIANLASNALITITVLIMLIFKPSTVLLLTLMMGIPTIVFLTMLIKTLKEYSSQHSATEVIRYGLQITIADLPVTLSSYIDDVMVSAFFGLNQLAIFSVAQLIPEHVKILCKDFLPISFAKQASGPDTMQRRMHLTKIVGMMTLVFAAGIITYIVVAPWIVPLLFPKYPASEVLLLTDVSAIILITFPASLFAQHLGARGMARELRNSQWLSAIAYCIALAALVPTLGPLGALLSRGIFRFIFAIYSMVAMFRAPEQRN